MRYDPNRQDEFVAWFLEDDTRDRGQLEEALRSIDTDHDFAWISDQVAARMPEASANLPAGSPQDTAVADATDSAQRSGIFSTEPTRALNDVSAMKLELLDQEAARRGVR